MTQQFDSSLNENTSTLQNVKNSQNSTSYTVINIFRIANYQKSFLICVYSNQIQYFKVDKSLNERISNGMVFVGDKIEIIGKTTDGVVFQVCEDATTTEPPVKMSDVDFFYSLQLHESQLMQNTQNEVNVNNKFLPFLCDILPYNRQLIPEYKATPVFKNDNFTGKYLVDKLEVSNIRIPLPHSFIAKVIQKTRINIYPTLYNPFFFLIVSSNDIFIKVVFWAESLKQYSSVKVGDIVMVKDYRMKRKWAAVEKMDYNTFTESIYFDVDEITAKEIVLIKYDKKTVTPNIFEVVEGNIEYLSLIMRANFNGCLMEYVLLKINGQQILLFYNSDVEFYNIEPGMKIQIKELRRITRADSSFFISTIYTQFEILPDVEPFTGPCIFGALGYFSDNFNSVEEIVEYQNKEYVNGTEISTSLFMKPLVLNIAEIPKCALVLNETKKFLVNVRITDIAEEECVISYSNNGETKKQGSFQLILDTDFKIYVFDNLFMNTSFKDSMFDKTNKEECIIGQNVNLVIEAFRADEHNVIYYLTGIIHG